MKYHKGDHIVMLTNDTDLLDLRMFFIGMISAIEDDSYIVLAKLIKGNSEDLSNPIMSYKAKIDLFDKANNILLEENYMNVFIKGI